jgi:hypothetical protein
MTNPSLVKRWDRYTEYSVKSLKASYCKWWTHDRNIQPPKPLLTVQREYLTLSVLTPEMQIFGETMLM